MRDRDQFRTPRSRGYFMPPEWHPHAATWLSWPTNVQTWPNRIEAVQEAFVRMICLLTQAEQVRLLVDDTEARCSVECRLRREGIATTRVEFIQIPTVDAWIRDYGPNFVLSRQSNESPIAVNAWKFNAWGGKYEDLKRDSAIPKQVATLLNLPCFEPGIVLEGGSFDVNGHGLCLVTKQCLLNPNRNPDFSRGELERLLSEFLGIRTVIWMNMGIAGDDTDGHIDDIVRFVDPETVVCATEADPKDENFEPLLDNLERLRSISEQSATPLRIVSLPMPRPIYAEWGRLPASYANFYIGNRTVLVPVFGQPEDCEALGILQSLFSTRKVEGIPGSDLIWGMGAVHCVTQQEPARPL